MGAVFTRPWSDFPDIHKRWLAHQEDVPYPNGENGRAVWTRCARALAPLLGAQYQRVAIVAHGGTIRSIICGALDIPQHRRFYFGLPPVNCSVSILKHQGGAFYLHSFNDDSHLRGLE